MTANRYGYTRFVLVPALLFTIGLARTGEAQPYSYFEAALTMTVNGEPVRNGTALATIDGNQLRVVGALERLSAPWAQADIYSGDPDDGGEPIANLAILLYNPNAVSGGFDVTVTLTDEQLENLQQGMLFVTITTFASDPESFRLKGRIMAQQASVANVMETPLSHFYGGQPVARGMFRAIPNGTALRLVGFFNALASNWQWIVITKGPLGSEREHVQTILNLSGVGQYLGFDRNLELGEGWQTDFENGLFHVEVLTSRAEDRLSGQLFPAANQPPPAAEILEPAESTSILVGGIGTPVDPDVYLGQVSLASVEDPDGTPVAYSVQASLRADFVGTTLTYDFGVDSTGMHLTVRKAAEIFDGLLAASEGGITLNSPRTVYFRTVTTDGSRFSLGNPIDVTFVRGLITATDSDAETPRAFVLHGNYPNPFNPSTTIVFDLENTSDVTIEVFDMTGRAVMVIQRGVMHAGKNLVDFDASTLTSGTYVYRVVATSVLGTASGSGRMTLLK